VFGEMRARESDYLTEEQLASLPDAGAVAFFQEHGWWVSPVCLDEELLDDVCYGAERYYVGERDWPLMINVATGDGQTDRIRTGDYVSLQMEEFQRLVHHPLLPAMAARLAGTPEIRLFHDQLLCKLPSDASSPTAIGWHTDKSYWGTCVSTKMLTAWVPLQDSTADMGSLAVFDASHRWSQEDDLPNFSCRELGPIEGQLRARYGAADPLVLELKRGQASFHHCRTIHGSRPNTSGRPRLACAIHYQDAENRYNDTRLADGRRPSHINDLLCRRSPDQLPDYSDPTICPRLWPPSAAFHSAPQRSGKP
jgi:ectoine hydroxylase-related dioxygenase (phytanoyl-CoA dioxygenase family)